jgi:hypothetical protein
MKPKERQKRPTWAPALILDGELLELVRSFGDGPGWWLKPEDKPVFRLWAFFSDPRRGPVVCEGFELRAGQERKGSRVFMAMHADRAQEIANRKKALFDIERRMKGFDPSSSGADYLRRVAESWRRKIAELEGRDSDWNIGLDCWYHNREKQARFERLQFLAHERVMEFCGDPDTQRRAGGQLTGRCGMCGKAMWDPISLEYGIGPECRSGYTVSRQAGLFTSTSVFGKTEWIKKQKMLKAMAAPEFIKALGLALPCTPEDVQRAYHRLALEAHPDVGGNHDDFIELKDNVDAAVEYLRSHASA